MAGEVVLESICKLECSLPEPGTESAVPVTVPSLSANISKTHLQTVPSCMSAGPCRG